MSKGQRYLFLWMLIAIGVFVVMGLMVLALLNRTVVEEEAPTPTSEGLVMYNRVLEAKIALNSGTAISADLGDEAAYENSQGHEPWLIPLSNDTQRPSRLNSASKIIPYRT
jgi:Flp pilus assembly protein CpaB